MRNSATLLPFPKQQQVNNSTQQQWMPLVIAPPPEKRPGDSSGYVLQTLSVCRRHSSYIVVSIDSSPYLILVDQVGRY
ncbi:hypothetical protein RIF29_14107 [Crotalaria pallida]|uniref:Uncharacterized protein n=1 Tax=Crotalaria pallida TaxID=3830 RepID=A0AAN9FEV4_CROPI